MLTKLTVRKFRGISEVALHDLSPINVITGLNDAGKTTLLEALFLLASGPGAALNAVRTIRPVRGQNELSFGDQQENPWEALHYHFDEGMPIELESDGSLGHYTLRLESAPVKSNQVVSVDPTGANTLSQARAIYVVEKRASGPSKRYTQSMKASLIGGENGKFTVDFSIDPAISEPYLPAAIVNSRVGADLAQGFSDSRRSRSFDLEEALKGIDSRINKLEVLLSAGRPELHADVNGAWVPLKLLGDGPYALANYLVSMSHARNGILLVDEIGSGLHYSLLGYMWRTLSRAARAMNVQVFATTHSRESLVAATAVLGQTPHDLSVYRLSRAEKDEPTEATAYSGSTLRAAVDLNVELR